MRKSLEKGLQPIKRGGKVKIIMNGMSFDKTATSRQLILNKIMEVIWTWDAKKRIWK